MDATAAKQYVAGVLSTHAAKPIVVISHADTDHYNLIPTVLAGVDVAHVWQGGDGNDYSSAGFPSWVQTQQNRRCVPSELPVRAETDRPERFPSWCIDTPLQQLRVGSRDGAGGNGIHRR